MTKNKYISSYFDHCAYFKMLKNESIIHLLFYVDDMLTASKNKVEIKKLKAQLRSIFEMINFGVAKKILGMKIRRNRVKEIVCLSQKLYCTRF